MKKMRERTELTEKGQQRRLMLLSAAIMIFVAQLDLNLIINGFRISLAVICLPVMTFLSSNFPVFPVTLIAAPGILLVRCAVEWLHEGSFIQGFWAYSPEMLFYLMYGGLFALYVHLAPMQHFSLLRLLPLVGIDMVSNMVEVGVRLGMRMFLPEVLLRLLIVALGRSALAAICLAALDAYGMFILNKDDRERYNHLLMLTSQLKSEVIWMNKNTNRIEDTMAVSYALYNQLNQMAVQEQSQQMEQLAQKALTVAKDIHEVKKEYYLIMNGISAALNEDDQQNGMWMRDILQTLQNSTRNGFDGFGENVQVSFSMEKNFFTDKHYELMSVLRNLINNAAEAAGEKQAQVVVSESQQGESYQLCVHDNCGGIEPEYLPSIFEPGFSTKIDYETGKVNWDYITADLDADHSGGDIIYGYMGVHPTTEQLWVGKSTYTQSAVHVYDVSRSDALEFSSFYQKKASPAGVDFAYRFSDEWINR